MIKYFNGERVLLKFETESETLSTEKSVEWYLGPVNYFIIREDGTLNGEELHKGDIVITLMEGEVAFKAPDNVANAIKNRINTLSGADAEQGD